MTNREMLLEKMLYTADPLNKALGRELLRIGTLSELEPWEELLIETTVEFGMTMEMEKSGHKQYTSEYSEFLITLVKLLVLPNPDDPVSDRNKALTMFFEKGTVHV